MVTEGYEKKSLFLRVCPEKPGYFLFESISNMSVKCLIELFTETLACLLLSNGIKFSQYNNRVIHQTIHHRTTHMLCSAPLAKHHTPDHVVNSQYKYFFLLI